MSSSGLKTQNFQIMTNDNKQQKISDSTDTAIAYSTCCVSGAVSKDGISLIHGDCLQALKSYGDNYFDVAIVDPPYGLERFKKGGSHVNKYGSENGKWNNEKPTKEYFDELFRVSKNQIIWGANNFELPTSEYFIIWQKSNAEDFSFAMCEMAWTNYKVPAKIYKKLHASVEDKNKIHPTQKPIELYKWILHNYTSEGDLILDTHLGSGSIAIACHQMKRKLIGYEIDAEYYQKACKRFEEQTRQTALW